MCYCRGFLQEGSGHSEYRTPLAHARMSAFSGSNAKKSRLFKFAQNMKLFTSKTFDQTTFTFFFFTDLSDPAACRMQCRALRGNCQACTLYSCSGLWSIIVEGTK